MTVQQFRKRPVVVEAIQWTGGNEEEIVAFTGRGKFNALDPEDRQNADDPEWTAQVFDDLHSTWVGVYAGQWIIKGVKREFYPCADDVFNTTYEPAQPPEIFDHPLYGPWADAGKRLRDELGATNAKHATWIPHPYSPTGLTLCAACELPEREEVHQHKCTETGCTAFEL